MEINSNVFRPEQTVLKHLLVNTEERLVWRFEVLSVCHQLYIDLVDKVYYYPSNLKNLGLCLDASGVITIQTLDKSAWDESLEPLTLTRQPLNNLIWYLAFKLSQGRILAEHSNQDYVYLTRWSDLGIEGCGQYVKLAAFMRNNAACLTDIVDKTATPVAELYNFYNACYLIAIVEKTQRPESRATVMNDDKQQLLKKINQRLQKIISE